MIEIECPWCAAPCRTAMDDILAETCFVSCEACGIAVQIGDVPTAAALALAA